MTYRDHAEAILLAEDLDTKLAIKPMAELEDTCAGGSPFEKSPAPERPGRPADLQMRRRGETGVASLPARPNLVDDESRGTLLHFFANHELLATELMALALLKFPDAPRAFRRGLLHTMQEEQRHTRWYVNRMRECGVEFGSHDLSRFFWDSVASMETPLDYVTRLSLTFEQANLDYSLHFAGIVEDAGDSKTAKILRKIYQDEITHVGYGLRWFRKWKAEGMTDWEAYSSRLIFPLSPSRAKGNDNAGFNRDGRLASGLDEDFIESLSVYERSKGRTPHIYWFNPDAEAAMRDNVDGAGYEPRRAMSQLTRDLEILPAFLAKRDDVVLMETPPSREHLKKLRDFGFTLPEFATYDDPVLRERKIGEMRPWAWCPRAAMLADSFAENQFESRKGWSEETRALFSKSTWADLGDGRICRSIDEVEAALDEWQSVAIKSPFGNSGWGNQRVRRGDETEANVLAWAEKTLEHHGGELVVEPRRENRFFDFSVQFSIDAEGTIKKLGYVRLDNDDRGQFKGCSAGPKFCRGLTTELARFLMTGALASYEVDTDLMQGIAKRLKDAAYQGPFGIDAFVYRDANDELALRTVCEVNPRFTMGRVVLELSKSMSKSKWAEFSLERQPPEESNDCIILNEFAGIAAVLRVR